MTNGMIKSKAINTYCCHPVRVSDAYSMTNAMKNETISNKTK